MNLSRSNISKLFFLLASSVYIFIFTIVAINTFLFVVGCSVSKWSLIASFFITILILRFPARGYFSSNYLPVLIFTLVLLFLVSLFSIINAGNVYDIGYDGQSYHQETIIHLSSGWNPFHEEIETKHPLWVNHFPKSSHIVAAALYQMTDNIEAGKASNLLLIAATLFLAISFFLQFEEIKLHYSIALSIVFSLNPVSVFQINSFYLDGQIASLLTSLMFLSGLLYISVDKFKLAVFAIIIVSLVGIKFTSLVYSLIFVLGFLTLLFVLKQKATMKRVILFAASAYLISIFVIGYNPYVTNIINKGNPFYPLTGKNKVDIISSNLPADLNNKNRFEKLLLTTFSTPQNYVGNTSNLKFKPPFAFDLSELQVFTPDIRIGGLGILWGTILTISFVGILLILVNKKGYKEYFIYMYISLITILVSVIINPECWWARYVPQFWLVPAIVCFGMLFFKNNLVKLTSVILMIFLSANAAFASYTSMYYSNQYSTGLKNTLRSLAAKGEMFEVYFGDFKSNKIRFNKMGVKFVEIQEERKINLECDLGVVKVYRKNER